MQIDLFERCDPASKAAITWNNGVLIGYRTSGAYYISLYRLDDFFVEMRYHTCYDGIASIHSFVCEEQLQPYLEQVDLSGLFDS